jgi:glucokinase
VEFAKFATGFTIRKAIMSKFCIGVDLGGTFIKFGLLDKNYRASDIFQLPTPVDGGSKGVIEQMVAGVKRLIETKRLDKSDVLGIGIGSPGPLSIAKGVVLAMPNIPGMENCPLRDRVSEGAGMRAVLENDANAAAFGEFIAGAGKGARDMVLLTLGTGVGSGIVIDGKVLHGAHEIGAEFGHMIVQPGGEKCGCGQVGCLERYCSATYLALRAQRQIEQGRASVLADVLLKKGKLNSRDINEARKAGDALAEDVWDQAMMYLAVACVNISRILDPDEIVLAGGMVNAGDDLMIPLRKHYHAMHWSLTPVLAPVVIATLGSDAGVIGAAGVAWESFKV